MSQSRSRSTQLSVSSSRTRRGDAAVLAQYIQDLSHPSEAGETAA